MKFRSLVLLWCAYLRSKLSDRLNRVNEDMRSELERVKASNRLDQNLEKARMDGKLVELRSTIEKLENRLETHRSSTRSRISEVKFDVLVRIRAFGVVCCCCCCLFVCL